MNSSATLSNIMSSTKSTDSCGHLKFNWPFLLLTVMLLIASLSSLWINVVLFKLIRRFQLFHANVRLLLLNGCLGNMVSNCSMTLRAFYNLAILRFGINAVGMARLQCAAFEIPFATGQIVFLSSVATIGFERCTATIKQNISDPMSSSTILKFFSVSFWFLGLFNTSLFALDVVVNDLTEGVCYCFIALSASDRMLYISAISYIPYLFE